MDQDDARDLEMQGLKGRLTRLSEASLRINESLDSGKPEAEPQWGVTALESVGIEGDHRNQTLKRLPAMAVT